jgi:hypothetical protein
VNMACGSALDLEPVVVKLMHPEPRQTAMSLAEADQFIAACPCFLQLRAWYPSEDIVPSEAVEGAPSTPSATRPRALPNQAPQCPPTHARSRDDADR